MPIRRTTAAVGPFETGAIDPPAYIEKASFSSTSFLRQQNQAALPLHSLPHDNHYSLRSVRNEMRFISLHLANDQEVISYSTLVPGLVGMPTRVMHPLLRTRTPRQTHSYSPYFSSLATPCAQVSRSIKFIVFHGVIPQQSIVRIIFANEDHRRGLSV